MEAITQIAILARPGHFRDSLAALLKTIPHTEMFLVGGGDRLQLLDPDLWVVDLSSLGTAEAPTALSERQAGARCLALVDDYRQARQARALRADLILNKSVPAGEFLRAVRQLSKPGLKLQAQAVGSEYPASLLYALEP